MPYIEVKPGVLYKKNKEGKNILLGRSVLAFWDEEGAEKKWYEAVVTNYDEATRKHCLTYDIGTSRASEEWAKLEDLLVKKQLKINTKTPVDLSTTKEKQNKVQVQKEIDFISSPNVMESKITKNEEDARGMEDTVPIKDDIVLLKDPKEIRLPVKISEKGKIATAEEFKKENKEVVEKEKEKETKEEYLVDDKDFCEKLKSADLEVLEKELEKVNEERRNLLDYCIAQDFDKNTESKDTATTTTKEEIFVQLLKVERLHRKRKNLYEQISESDTEPESKKLISHSVSE